MGPRAPIRGRWALMLAVALALGAGLAWRGGPGSSDGISGTADHFVESPAAPFPAPGSTARDFELPLLGRDGSVGPGSVRLSEYRGRWVYLDVFGSWCLPCLEKYPMMRGVARELEEDGAAVLGLLLHDRPERAAAWFADNGGMAYPFAVLDEGTSIAWGLTGAPMGFLVSPEGRIVRKCYGCATGGHAVDALPAEIRSRVRRRGGRGGVGVR